MFLGLGALLLVALLVAVSLEAPRRIRLSLAAALAVTHLAYIVRYSTAYSLGVKILPFVDILVDAKGRASAVLDFTQLMVAYMIANRLLTRREDKNINPSPPASHEVTEPRPGPG
jgi:hypothetical protein